MINFTTELLNRKFSLISSRLTAASLSHPRFVTMIYIVLTLASILWMTFRIHFAVDFTDESYYLALPLSYEFGAKPFVDEINPHHTMALLLWPLVKLFLLINDTTDGIVLFFRFVFVTFSGVCSLIIFNTFKKKSGPLLAFLFALSVFLLVPFSIPALSYNTLGLFLSLMAAALAQNENKYAQVASGIASVLAIFSYPPLLIPFFAWGISRIIWRKDFKQLGYFTTGAVIAAIPLLIVLIQIGIDDILKSLNNAKSLNVHKVGLDKVSHLWGEIQAPLLRKIPFLVLSLFLLKNLKRLSILISIIFWAYLAELFNTSGEMSLNANLSFFYICLASSLGLGVYFFRYYKNRFSDILFATIACLTTGYASANGAFNFSIMTPLLILAIIATVKENSESILRFSLALGIGALCFFNAYSFGQFVYRDDAPFSKLDARVETGPFSGLYTSHEKKSFLENVQRNLNAHLNPSIRSIAFFDDFPAGYLMTKKTVKANSIWSSFGPAINRSVYIPKATSSENLPDFVYFFNQAFYTSRIQVNYPLDEPVRTFFVNNQAYQGFSISPTQWIFVKRGL